MIDLCKQTWCQNIYFEGPEIQWRCFKVDRIFTFTSSGLFDYLLKMATNENSWFIKYWWLSCLDQYYQSLEKQWEYNHVNNNIDPDSRGHFDFFFQIGHYQKCLIIFYWHSVQIFITWISNAWFSVIDWLVEIIWYSKTCDEGMSGCLNCILCEPKCTCDEGTPVM